MMRVATAIRIAFRIRCFFICLYSFERIYFAGLKLSRRVTTRLYTPGFLLSGVKKPVRTNWNFSPGLASFRALFQLAVLAHHNALGVQVVLVVAALGDGVHVGLGEQLVVQADFSIHSVVSADPVDGALDLAAIGGVAVAGLKVGGAVDGGDAAVGVLLHALTLDDV